MMSFFNQTNSSNSEEEVSDKLNYYYIAFEVLVAVFAVVGNAMVILVFKRERRLRRRTNYYIVSLATADFFVGLLGIPFAILASVGLPSNLYACLFTVSLLVVLCTISIFCLVAVSVDRYWAILHPMGYSRNVRTKTALVIIGICWFAGSVIGFLPLMGWHNMERQREKECYFLDVMDMNYLVFLYFGTIITPALVLAAFYAHIYRVVLKQLRQTVTISPSHGTSTSDHTANSGTMLRMLGAAQKREVKATQNLSIIVVFFMICWIPLYTINCIIAFCETCEMDSTFMKLCIILSHANSAGNPLLYAYHLRDFRTALKHLLHCFVGHSFERNSAVYNYRASVGSTACQNPLGHYKFPNMEASSRHSLPRRYVESPIYFDRLNKSRSLSSSPNLLSIVPTSVAVAAVTAVDKVDIWKISDIPAILEDNESSDTRTPPSSPYHNLETRSYLNTMDFNGDDDVFLDDTIPITEDNIQMENGMNVLTEKAVVVRKREVRGGAGLSNSSPQLCRSLFLVENEIGSDKTGYRRDEGARNAFRSGDHIHTVDKGTKLSPFKVVGGFLWNRSKRRKSASLSDDSDKVSPRRKVCRTSYGQEWGSHS